MVAILTMLSLAACDEGLNKSNAVSSINVTLGHKEGVEYTVSKEDQATGIGLPIIVALMGL